MSLSDYIMRSVAGVEKSENRVKVTLCIPNDLPHLEGHFPGSPITPTIILIEISSLLIGKHFEIDSREYKELKKSKVMKMIIPDSEHTVDITKTGDKSFDVVWLNHEDQASAKFKLEY